MSDTPDVQSAICLRFVKEYKTVGPWRFLSNKVCIFAKQTNTIVLVYSIYVQLVI